MTFWCVNVILVILVILLLQAIRPSRQTNTDIWSHGRKWRSITIEALHCNRSKVQSSEERIIFVIDEREAPVRKTGARAGVVC